MAYHLFRSCLLITEPSELMAISKYIYVWFINKTIFEKKGLLTVLHKSKKALKREATLKIRKKISWCFLFLPEMTAFNFYYYIGLSYKVL